MPNLQGTSTNQYDWTAPFSVEGDIISSEGTIGLQLYEQSTGNYVTQTFANLGITNGGHFKMTYDGHIVRYYGNGELKYTREIEFTEKLAIRVYLNKGTSFTYKNFEITTGLDNDYPLIIPNDTFIVEVLTYDDYRWVKGYPENDNNELYDIYREDKSYTQYLTFKVKKLNIKKIEILEDDELIFEKELYHFLPSEKGSYIVHDYQAQKKIETYENVLVSDVEDEDYKFQLVLEPEDFYPLFDWSVLQKDYPETSEYIVNDIVPASEETIGKIVVKYERGRYNAYETVKEEGNYIFKLYQYNIPHTIILKHNYDLKVYLYDKNKPNCKENKYILTKRYNGYDKNNEDCFCHDYSLDVIGHYWNVPRLNFITKDEFDEEVEEYYSQTLPPYNNRLTEDDYHYQNRIKKYIYDYNVVHFPVLELWKNYGIDSELFNRKDILSKMDKSYLCEVNYYDDNHISDYSDNKLTVTDGFSNKINVQGVEWFESVICSNLFVVPDTEYHLNYSISMIEPLIEPTPTFHLYYCDKTGNCHHEEKITPILNETSVNEYNVDYTFKTISDACRLDIVLEYDNPFTYANALLERITVVDISPMFMTTKEDYNSCVYELQTNYKNVPTNINFTNNKIFEKLLQRSLPLSHKGFLNIEFDNEENDEIMVLNEDLVCNLIEYFDKDNNNDAGDKDYDIQVDRFINGGSRYRLKVTFLNESVSPPCTEGCKTDGENSNCTEQSVDKYIYSYLNFRENFLTDEVTSIVLPTIECNKETTVVYNFQCPEDMHIMNIQFHSTSNFTYKNLSLKRFDDINETELWRTND